MPDIIDLNDETFVSTLILEISSSERDRRITEHLEAYQVYRGALKEKVKKRLAQQRPRSWKKFTIANLSVSKVVVNKLAQAYRNPPIRSVEGDETKSDNLKAIYSEMQAHRFWNELDEVYNLQNEVMMWPRWDITNQKWYMTVLAPYEFSVVKDKDTAEVQVVVLHFPNSKQIRGTGQGDGKSDIIAESQDDSSSQGETYALWSKDQHVVVNVRRTKINFGDRTEVKIDIDFVAIKGNPNNINPLGILPFAYLSKDTSPDLPYFNPITDQTIDWNVRWSELLTGAGKQSTGQFTLSYPESMQGNMDDVIMGMDFAVELPQKEAPGAPRTEAKFINANPQLESHKTVLMDDLKFILKQQGIFSTQGVVGESEAFSSALERMIANSDIQGIIEANQSLYKEIEQQAFQIIKAWDRLISLKENKPRLFEESDELSVIFEKPRVMISDSEVLGNIEKRLSLGLLEKWEAFQILDPNLSDAQAREKADRIKESEKDNVKGFLNGNKQGHEDTEIESRQGAKESLE